MAIKLGSTVREKVTGLVGTALARLETVDGRPRVRMSSPDGSDDPWAAVWIDEDRLTEVEQLAQQPAEAAP